MFVWEIVAFVDHPIAAMFMQKMSHTAEHDYSYDIIHECSLFFLFCPHFYFSLHIFLCLAHSFSLPFS